MSATEKGTGVKQSITISGSGSLNRDEIERMVREAELNAESDRKAQEFIELKNKAESLAYQTEKTLKDAGEKVDEASRQSATERIEELRTALKGDDQSAIEAAFNALESESHKIAEKLYQATEGAANPAGAAAHDGDVIDAEFKEEK